MTKDSIDKKLRLPNALILLSIIFFSCASLIFINYFTIKILSANRAYVNGESHYSKGQKDAVRHLITYLYTEDNTQWELFRQELNVPKSDGAVRIELIQNSDDKIIKKDLKAGRNHEEDFDDMIWLFRNFNSVSFFKKAINEWEQGDVLINQFDSIGNKIHNEVQNSRLNDEIRIAYLYKINIISDKLSVNQRNFSYALGEGTRKIKGYLIYTNILFILIIIGSVSAYYIIMVRKLTQSQTEIIAKNNDLQLANKELDKFVYSASHDLRSPITSLKGLVEILSDEENPDEAKNYLALMKEILNKQDQFIRDIIDYSRNKRISAKQELINLTEIIDGAIMQLQYIDDVKQIEIRKELSVEKLCSDHLRLKIIVNNLLSNAIKYADFNKQRPFISIKTFISDNQCIIKIEDNGIGIEEKFLPQIFEMFFVTNTNKGTGLGLYIVKETIENLSGSIAVTSEINIGTSFVVTIPYHEEC